MDSDLGSLTHCSLACFVDELATFMPPGDLDFQVILTNLFDCPEHWVYSLISRNDTVFENAYISLLGAITPSMIPETFGQRAVGMGFTSRVIFIYSDTRIRRDPFPKSRRPDYDTLAEDLAKVYTIKGEFTLSEEAERLYRSWYDEDMPPAPLDSRFEEYLPRRWIHWLKLAMVLCAGRNSSTLIEAADINDAKEILLEAERFMPKALEAFGQNPMLEAVRRAHRWAIVEYHSNGKQPIDEMYIKRQLSSSVSPNYLEATLHSMLTTGLLVQSSGAYPHRFFVPVPKE